MQKVWDAGTSAFAKALKSEASAPKTPLEVFEHLKTFRDELGAIPSKTSPDGASLVYLEESGTYGMSGHGQNAQARQVWKGIIDPKEATLFHGEGDLFTQLKV